MTPEEEAQEIVEWMKKVDPDTVEVVNTMRSQWKSWCRIVYCFRSHIASLKTKHDKF